MKDGEVAVEELDEVVEVRGKGKRTNAGRAQEGEEQEGGKLEDQVGADASHKEHSGWGLCQGVQRWVKRFAPLTA